MPDGILDTKNMALQSRRRERQGALYEEDFFQWTQCTARLLREGKFREIDAESVAEEIEDMGKRERREMGSRMRVLLMHLLKWQLQPELRTSSWRFTIQEQRRELRALLEDSPSLERLSIEVLSARYSEAVEDASEETGLSRTHFPSECPYTSAQVLDLRFFPSA
jgi:hypothetical protein